MGQLSLGATRLDAFDTQLPPLALLAGGLATRLRPLTEQIPKSMVEVAGLPFIAHQLRQIREEGIRRVVICAGHLWKQISDYVDKGEAFGLNVDYSLDGPVQLGTGGALRKALPLLGPEFLVMYGDSYLPTRFSPVVSGFHRSGKLALMTVYRNSNRWDKSNVFFNEGKILQYDKYHQTPDMQHIDYGLGVFRAEALMRYPESHKIDLAEIHLELLRSGDLAGYEIHERFYEVGSLAGLMEARAVLQREEIQ